MAPQYKDARGMLTGYALACGYMETETIGTVAISLWKEHGAFHVRAHCKERGRLFWESFRNADGGIKAARKRYNRARKEAKTK
jgi:hypothetical protein